MRHGVFLLAILAFPGFAKSDDVKAHPASDPRTAAATAPPLAEEMKPVTLARRFLRLLGESKDEEAYALTTEEYRTAHTADDFSRDARTRTPPRLRRRPQAEFFYLSFS